MLYQQPAAATKRLLGISRSSSSWPRSNRRAPPLPRPRSSWPRPLTYPCLRPPVSTPPTTSTKSTPIRSSARASCSSCRYSQKGSPPVPPQSMRPPRGRCRPFIRSGWRSPLSHNQPFQKITLAPQHTMQAQFITNDEQRKLLDQVSSNTSTNLLS